MPKTTQGVAARPVPGSDFATAVRETALPASRIHSIFWCFCELCGQQTEYAVATSTYGIFKRIEKNGLVAVPLTDAIRTEAKSITEDLVAQYEQAVNGSRGPYAVGQMLFAFCDMREMGGDFSVASFQDQVTYWSMRFVWARNGDMYKAPQLPGSPIGRQRPSKLYCNLHYPGRSVEARRAYQRDRKSVDGYEEVVGELWRYFAGELSQWDIDDHALVRDAAYHILRLIKARTRALDDCPDLRPIVETQKKLRKIAIEDYYETARAAFHRLPQTNESNSWFSKLQLRGVMNQSEIARQLKISKQAVSAAMKKRAASRARAAE